MNLCFYQWIKEKTLNMIQLKDGLKHLIKDHYVAIKVEEDIIILNIYYQDNIRNMEIIKHGDKDITEDIIDSFGKDYLL